MCLNKQVKSFDLQVTLLYHTNDFRRAYKNTDYPFNVSKTKVCEYKVYIQEIKNSILWSQEQNKRM